jgi:chromosome segregation ATPase
MTNPFLLPPVLLKRALDDLHAIGQLARRLTALEGEVRERLAEAEDELRERVDRIEAELARVRAAVEPLPVHLDEIERELAPMQHLKAVRDAVEPLEHSMVAVRQSVDELEPMIQDLDGRVQRIDPKLSEIQDAVTPIGDLAERLPGGGRRRRG